MGQWSLYEVSLTIHSKYSQYSLAQTINWHYKQCGVLEARIPRRPARIPFVAARHRST